MQLQLIRHLWGIDQAWELSFPRIRAEGFTGIECPLPRQEDRPRFRALLAAHGFTYIPQIHTGGRDAAAHAAHFAALIEDAATFAPPFINCHSGNDCWSDADNHAYFAAVLASEARLGIPVCHELHRGRILFHPTPTRALLTAFPGLKVCCDYSHWVCVCQRLPDDQADVFQLCADRALHIHARVGYEHGPQVSDPRAPEFARHVEAHERWWSQVWDSQERRGFAVTTLAPEFGPPGYLHTLPYTNAPVADLWAICAWQAARQRDRFSQRVPASAAAAAHHRQDPP
jgi:hypothetical protein